MHKPKTAAEVNAAYHIPPRQITDITGAGGGDKIHPKHKNRGKLAPDANATTKALRVQRPSRIPKVKITRVKEPASTFAVKVTD